MELLQIKAMSRRFGGLEAVKDLSLDIRPGEIFGLIGPNGAGKSTTLNMIDGSLAMSKGQIQFKGEDISALPAHSRVRRGMARVFQRDVLFHSLSVIDNVMLGLHRYAGLGIREALFVWSTRTRKKENELKAKSLELLKFVGMADRADAPSVNLPHGSKRMLGLAIAMATGAELFLLDEPLTGMNAEETDFILQIICNMRDQKGATIAVVEHNMKAVLGLCDRVAVLDYGVKIAEGSPSDVVADERVIEAYLGAEYNAV